MKIVLTYLVCLCIVVCPSHTSHAQPISTFVTYVEAPYFAPYPPLPASKTVLSSRSLVVICALTARATFKPQLEFSGGISFQAGTSSYHVLYKYDNIESLEVPEDHLYNTYESLKLFFCFFAVIQLFIVHPPQRVGIQQHMVPSMKIWKRILIRALCTWYLGAYIYMHIHFWW